MQSHRFDQKSIAVTKVRPNVRSEIAARREWRVGMVPPIVMLGIVTLVACGSSKTSPEEQTGSTAAALTTSPLWFIDQKDPVNSGSRPVVAVGRDYALLSVTGSVQGFPRNKTDGKGSIATDASSYSKDFSDIFSAQVTAYNAQIVAANNAFPTVANPVLPVSKTTGLNPATGTTSCGTADAQNAIKPPVSGCAYTMYDGDTVYDEYSGHFFMMTKIRRPVWDCQGYTFDVPNTCQDGTGWWDGQRDATPANNPIGPCNCAPQAYVDQVKTRSILLAVSKCNPQGLDCENPSNGWNTYTLTGKGVGDWAQIVVTRGLVMVNSHEPDVTGTIWGFRASDLINGTVSNTPPPSFQFNAGDFALVNAPLPLMFAGMHRPTSSDFPILVTMDGSNVAAFNVVPTNPAYVAAANSTPNASALWDLSPWTDSLVVTRAATAPVPASMGQQFNAHPVWSADSNLAGGPGSLYWSFVGGNTPGSQGIGAFRWPLYPARPSTGVINPPILSVDPAKGYVAWNAAFGNGSSAYDFPVLEHNAMSGDTVLLFHTVTGSIPSGPLFESPAYAVAGPADLTFAVPQSIAIASGSSTNPTKDARASAGGTEDILSNVSDPIRPQVFMTSAASGPANGGVAFTPWLTAVQLPDGPTTPQTALFIPTGGSATRVIPFVGSGTSISSAPVTCSAGGDLPSSPQFLTSAAGVSVLFSVPLNVTGTFIEGVSCTNGTSAVIPITTTPATFYANPSTIDIMQGGSSGYTLGTSNLVITDPVLSACTSSYVIVASTLPAGVSAAMVGAQLHVEVFSNAPIGTYTVDIETGGCANNSIARVYVNVEKYVCSPQVYCLNQGISDGLQCGSVSDGCGNMDNCGTCPSGQVCSSNMCCPTGQVWNANQNACGKPGGGKTPPCKGTTCS